MQQPLTQQQKQRRAGESTGKTAVTVILFIITIAAVVLASVALGFGVPLERASWQHKYCFIMTARDVPPYESNAGSGDPYAYCTGTLTLNVHSGLLSYYIQTNYNSSGTAGNGNSVGVVTSLAIYSATAASITSAYISGLDPTLSSTLVASQSITLSNLQLLRNIVNSPYSYILQFNTSSGGSSAARLNAEC